MITLAIRGELGAIAPHVRLSPLASMFSFFDARTVARTHAFLDALRATDSIWEVAARIEGIRKGAADQRTLRHPDRTRAARAARVARMSKPRVLFVHGAGVQDDGLGSSALAAYLRRVLADRFDVRTPRMPTPDAPAYEPWRVAIERELARGIDIAIGHSLGGSVLVKLLAERPAPPSLRALFTVAAPYWGADEDWSNPEYVLPQDLSALDRIPHIGLVHSRDDEVVPFEHLARYAQRLPRATVHPVDGRGHSFEAGVPELVAEISA